jgi:hypothetical protein
MPDTEYSANGIILRIEARETSVTNSIFWSTPVARSVDRPLPETGDLRRRREAAACLLSIWVEGSVPPPAHASPLGDRCLLPWCNISGSTSLIKSDCEPGFSDRQDAHYAGDDNRKLCSLYLSLMDRMGVKLEHFGDAETRLAICDCPRR